MVIKSPIADIAIPNVDIWTFLFERKDKPYPDEKEMFIDGQLGRSYTFAQIKNLALEFGKGLQAQWGWKKGDCLGVFSPNTIDYPPVIWGTVWTGGVCSTANPTYTVKELSFQLKDSQCKAVITQLPMLPTVIEAAKNAGIPENRILLMGHGKDPTGKFKHWTEIRSTGLFHIHRPAKIDPQKDLAFLVYSSGTTGLPKGVVLTHRNMVSNVLQSTACERISGLSHSGGIDGQGDKQLAVLPFYHVYGLTCILHQTVYDGYQVIVLPKFELEKALQLIQNYAITFAYIPPPIVLAFAKHPLVAKYDISSLKWLNSGAAPLGKELIDEVWERLGIPVKQGYGLSETAPVALMLPALEWQKAKGSVGKLVPNMEAKVVDVNGAEVPQGQEGELWLKGPNVFPGYLNRPELKDETFSSCGFFRTGDICFVDPKGNFHITDRMKELIKYKGFQVAPAELEAILLGHDEIVDACVVPAHDHDRASEVPRAYVVVAKGIPRTEEKAKEIEEWLAKHVSPHKKLRGGVRFIDEVPKNPSGKILRRILKERAKQEDRAEGARL